MKELVVLSGKGGTGKTSLTAAFATLARDIVVADCDVDAANLHILLHPEIRESGDFFGGHEARIREEDCISCGLCESLCRFGSITEIGGRYRISQCEGCGVCVEFCPEKAIDWNRSLTGRWMVSDTGSGRMVHARLRPGAENSGKLASKVRDIGRKEAAKLGVGRILIDGPPGIGCPAIASLTGAHASLVVTEPTPSGMHDLDRLLDLARHFGVETRILVNKCDLNEDLAAKIVDLASERGCTLAGMLPYDTLFTRSQIAGIPIPRFAPESELAKRIHAIWKRLEEWTTP